MIVEESWIPWSCFVSFRSPLDVVTKFAVTNVSQEQRRKRHSSFWNVEASMMIGKCSMPRWSLLDICNSVEYRVAGCTVIRVWHWHQLISFSFKLQERSRPYWWWLTLRCPKVVARWNLSSEEQMRSVCNRTWRTSLVSSIPIRTRAHSYWSVELWSLQRFYVFVLR